MLLLYIPITYGMEQMSYTSEHHADECNPNNFSLIKLPKELVHNICIYLADDVNNCLLPTVAQEKLVENVLCLVNKMADVGIITLKDKSATIERLLSITEKELIKLYELGDYVINCHERRETDVAIEYEIQADFSNSKQVMANDITRLTNAIKDFMSLSIICKHLHALLTFEEAGKFFKNYRQSVKDFTLQHVMQTKNHSVMRLPILLLICAGADCTTEAYFSHPLLLTAVEHNDIQMVTMCFKHNGDPNIKVKRAGTKLTGTPILFYVKTKELAQLFIDNGADTHNVLRYIIDKDEYSTDLIELYLKYGIAEQLNPDDGSCILHCFCDRFTTNMNFGDYMRRGELLLNAIPHMINACNNRRQTPLDVAIERYNAKLAEKVESVIEDFNDPSTIWLTVQEDKEYEMLCLESLFVLFKKYGNIELHASILPDIRFKDLVQLYEEEYKHNRQVMYSSVNQDTKDCKCVLI